MSSILLNAGFPNCSAPSCLCIADLGLIYQFCQLGGKILPQMSLHLLIENGAVNYWIWRLQDKKEHFLSQREELHFSSFNLDKIESTELSFRGKSWERGKGGVWNSGIGLSVAGAKEDVRNALALVFVYLYLCICVHFSKEFGYWVISCWSRGGLVRNAAAAYKFDWVVTLLQPLTTPHIPLHSGSRQVCTLITTSSKTAETKSQQQKRVARSSHAWIQRTRLYLVTVCHSVESSAQRVLLHSFEADI